MREYEGTGTLHYPGISIINGAFRLAFKENGKTTLKFMPEGKSYLELLNLPSDPGRFVGESKDPKYTVIIDRVYDVDASFHEGSARLKFDISHPVRITYHNLREDDEIELVQGLSNFLLYGLESTQRGKELVRDTLRCMLDEKEVFLIQLSGFKKIKKHLKEFRDVRTTCELKVKGKYGDLGSLRELSQNTQVLCSLASGNYVTEMYQDIFKENTLSETQLFPLKTYPFSNRPPLIDIKLHGVKELKEYLELTYQKYVNLKDPLGLPYVIEFFVTSKLHLPMEVQFMLTTTTLECLECYFRERKQLRKESLKEKTRRILDYFKIPYSGSDLDFVKIRNSIVHAGRFPLNCDEFSALMGLRNLVDRLFLGILEYRGKPYFNIVKQKKDTI